MKKLLFASVVWMAGMVSVMGQGTVRGKITDEKGEPIPGATVVMKSRPTVGSLTDFDGNFSLKIPDSTAQVIVISSISFKTVEFEVQLRKGQVAVKDVVLYSDAKEIGEVKV